MNTHSLKFKFTCILTAVLLLLVGMIVLFNITFAEKFYDKSIQSSLLDDFCKIDSLVNDYRDGKITESEMQDSIESISSTDGISLIIVGNDWSTFYSSNRYDAELVKRLEINIFSNDFFSNPNRPDNLKPDNTPDRTDNGNDDNPSKQNQNGKPNDKIGNKLYRFELIEIHEEREIIEQNDEYTMQKIYDSRLSDTYIELFGDIADGQYSVLIRHPYQSIKNAVGVTNTLVCIIAGIVLILGIIIMYVFSGVMTKPIKELSVVAKRMTDLDFTEKYTGDDKGEIGELGACMNELSTELEKNISQLKTANLELKRDLENKERLEEMRSEFLSNVSHELKTPIALIQGYAEGLKEGVTDDPESMAFYCDVIMDESAKMNNMVKRLLTLNQLEFGNEELIMEHFNLTELVEAVANANDLRAAQKDITIVRKIAPKVYAWCDEYKIEEVVTNYITNAINHCDGEKQILVSVNKNQDKARVSVFNTGNHIPEKDINRIWDKFYKVDKARTREYGGNGIGLSIVRAIMESYNCAYGVENVDGGVEFWFELDCKNR